jgi:hypothetical protein
LDQTTLYMDGTHETTGGLQEGHALNVTVADFMEICRSVSILVRMWILRLCSAVTQELPNVNMN